MMRALTFKDWLGLLVTSSLMTLTVAFFLSKLVGGKNMGLPEVLLTLAVIMAALFALYLSRIVRRRQRVLAGLEPETPAIKRYPPMLTDDQKGLANYQQSKGFLLYMLAGFAVIATYIVYLLARGQIHL